MNKVFVLAPNENWIVDRFVKEWNEDNCDITVSHYDDCQVLWLFADWCFNHVPINVLQTKKVITTIHHIVPEKFNDSEKAQFRIRDQFTDVYHVPNKYTYDFVKQHTTKPIVLIGYWANQNIWKETDTKQTLRKKYNIPVDALVMGSFQRDTEGSDLISPKLEKGPDLLGDYFDKIHEIKLQYCSDFECDPLHVVLAGWRRQYVISRLNKSGISFSYFEKPDQSVINELYQTLDLYPITARHEGGPQSLIECGLLNIPVISTPVGMADSLLPRSAIGENLFLSIPTVPNVQELLLPRGYEPFRRLINSL